VNLERFHSVSTACFDFIDLSLAPTVTDLVYHNELLVDKEICELATDVLLLIIDGELAVSINSQLLGKQFSTYCTVVYFLTPSSHEGRDHFVESATNSAH
jgi:hypothetical protein